MLTIQSVLIDKRWMRLAMPDDVAQEIALVDLLLPPGQYTEASRARLLLQRLRILRHEVWDRIVSRQPRSEPNLRPSKLRQACAYRKNSERHSIARNKVAPDRRKEIARMGQAALRARKAA